jgi:hypothetical protein
MPENTPNGEGRASLSDAKKDKRINLAYTEPAMIPACHDGQTF